MRVLFVQFGENWIRGSERCMLDLAAALIERGDQSTVVCNAPTVADAARALGARSHIVPAPSRPGPLPGRAELRAWRRIIRDVAPDVIHVNDLAYFPPILVAAIMARTPVLVHQHLQEKEFSRLYSFLHQASAIVTISEEAYRAVLADGYPAERLHRIPNGVRVQPGTSNASARTLTGAGPDDIVAISVGSLIVRKGFDRVIAGLRAARDGGSPLQLAIVGNGVELAELTSLAARLGVERFVHFLGERSDVQALMRTADLFVTGARGEVQPLTVIEAMLSGLPVVASDIRPHVEMVDHGETGILVDADDPVAFGRALGRVAGDHAWRQAARHRLAEITPARYGFDRYIERFMALYRTLASGGRSQYGFPRALRRVPGYGHWLRRVARQRLFGDRTT